MGGDVPQVLQKLRSVERTFHNFPVTELLKMHQKATALKYFVFPHRDTVLVKLHRSKIEDLLDEAGLKEEEITIRMTGCPNGCARPALAEVAFIGKGPGKYNMYLGGGFIGDRLNKIYKENENDFDKVDKNETIIIKDNKNKFKLDFDSVVTEKDKLS